MCFNPRPHARGNCERMTSILRPTWVSIHAPTRGATPYDFASIRLYTFQSTPPHEERQGWLLPRPSMLCFNPRPHTRGNQWHDKKTITFVSFNPRPHTRGDIFSCVLLHRWHKFQSTPPREGRRLRIGSGNMVKQSFNPRPHARGDALTAAIINAAKHVSIHAPARGATHRP